jgi:hypothetical protein
MGTPAGVSISTRILQRRSVRPEGCRATDAEHGGHDHSITAVEPASELVDDLRRL